MRKSPAFADPVQIDASTRAWNRHMALLDDVLRGTDAFVTGQSFTLADVVLGLATHRWMMTPMARPDLPSVAAYYDRLGERAGFRAHCRDGIP